MCGICGFAGNINFDNKKTLQSMNDSIIRRGPDEEGFFSDEKVGLAMRRLSIMDLEHGSQPIFNETKNVCTIFNGEIYNYKELRTELIEKGHQFETNCDTEVIVHLYEEYGENFVKKLRGMFAIALWDHKTEELYIARDQIGIKPLYYAYKEGTLYFGSEIKTIRAAKQLQFSLNHQAVDAFLTYMFIPAPLTIYNEIKKLKPGHYIKFKHNNFDIIQYWQLDFPQNKNHDKNQVKTTQKKIKESIKAHLQSDVPMGSFLSGGLDSSLIVAYAAKQLNYTLEAFTVFFKGNENKSVEDERPYARELAKEYDFKLNEIECSQDFHEIIDDIINAFDEPFGDDSVIPNYYVCQETARKVKVALSGLGGDELYAGYRRHNGMRVAKYLNKLPLIVLQIIKQLVSWLPEPRNSSEKIDHIKRFFNSISSDFSDTYYGFFSSIDKNMKENLYTQEMKQQVNYQTTKDFVTNNFNHLTSTDPIDRALYTDLKLYMPDQILVLSDRLSMWHSLEVRVPLADIEVIEHSTQIPSNLKLRYKQTKFILREIASKVLPSSIIMHKKQGFIPPMASWLKNELKDFLSETLSKKNIQKHNLFNYENVNKLINDHVQGKRKNNKILFCLLMFQLWYEKFENTLESSS